MSEGKNGREATSMEAKGVVFKGSTDGLGIIVPEGYSVDQLLLEVTEKMKSSARFFKGARLRVTYRGIKLSAEEETRLLCILDEGSGAVVESLHALLDEGGSVTSSKPAGSDAFPRKSSERPRPEGGPLRRFFSRGEDETDCKFIKNTLRGGTRVQYDGSVVVLGDVNPGAEIVATGNVIVLGMLRGMVHAGSGGSRNAFITALKLIPTQLRIADLIARRPDDEDEPGIYPEIASVKEGAIEVNPLYERV